MALSTIEDTLNTMRSQRAELVAQTGGGYFIADAHGCRIGRNAEIGMYGFEVRHDVELCTFVQRHHADFILKRLAGGFPVSELRVVTAADWRAARIATIDECITLFGAAA